MNLKSAICSALRHARVFPVVEEISRGDKSL